MIEFFSLLGDGRFAPKAQCVAHDPLILAMYVAGYSMATIAFFFMGLLLMFSRTPPEQSPYTRRLFAWLFLMLSVAIGMSAATFFLPVYRLDAIVAGATGTLAILTLAFSVRDLLGLKPDDFK